ncbi:MAG TPA: cellulose synthase operon protein YhjQ/BcsQ, partial [Acidobacteriaceae bacterium]|nr:cellulose synthase operon protein YhjQ/BcsQ [Acidobacteriaceae bacterium]
SANAIEAGEPGDLRELGPVPAADERDAVPDPASRGLSPADEPLPSWIVTPEHDKGDGSARSSVREALQHSRERFASRWYALRELFSPSSKRTEPEEPPPAPALPPLLAIFSLAGGVGKTTLAAAIARVLSAGGERVLLVDTTPHGILPFHFGARELRPGVGRTFTPPAGSPDQPIQLVSYPGMDGSGLAGANDAETFETRLRRDSTGFARVIVDVSAPSILDNLVQLGARVLVPVASTMNSVLGLPTVRDICADLRDRENKPVQPGFLLTHFDASQPLQLDIREVLQQHLGEGLLPFFVRRSPRVPEALAEGMTVIDFAPGETVTADYRQTAAWVRTLGEPARGDLRHARWSER